MRFSTSLTAAALLVISCGGQAPAAHASPTPQPSATPGASPKPAASDFGVLVTPTTGETYTIAVVAADGTLAGSAQASGLPALTCAGVASAVLPLPVSTSNSKAYFMDAQGVVHFLTPQGATGRATSVPIGSSRRSAFSVSPDDSRIAVAVSDFGAGSVSLKLYVEDLNGGGHHVQIYTQTGKSGLWPIGWHGGSLVLAVVPACVTAGGFGCCGPQELHVVDPATAGRRFTIGGSVCIIGGPSTPAGTPCETAGNAARVLDWAGVTVRTVPIPKREPVYLAPDGRHLAYATGAATSTVEGLNPMPMAVCGWIDSNTVLAGGDAQTQPRVGNVTSGSVAPVAAQGDCAGRIPGAL